MSQPNDFPEPQGFDDDVETIDDSMLHRGPVVDFEAKMSPAPPLTLALMAACIVVFCIQLTSGGLHNLDTLIHQGALVPERVAHGEWWRMISAAFLHGGPDHLIGNILMLFALGMACEHAFGLSQFLVLYLGSALSGSLLSMLGSKPSVGASGAIFGLAGALIVLFWRCRDRLHVRDRRIGIVLLLWAGYQLLLGFGFMGEVVDNRAHLGGLLGGMVLGLVLRPAVLESDRAAVDRNPLVMGATALAGLALLAALGPFLQHLTS
jgi:rhomboid protease GluP